MMRKRMPLGPLRSRANNIDYYRNPSASTSPEPDQPHRSGGEKRSLRTKPTTTAMSRMVAAPRASGAKRLFLLTLSRPILGGCTTYMATYGNGRRTAGQERMLAPRATARRGRMEIVPFACCAALPGTTTHTHCALPDATWSLPAIGSPALAFALQEHCDVV